MVYYISTIRKIMNSINKTPATIITPNSIGIYLNGKMHNVGKDHPNFEKIKDALKKETYDLLENLFDIPKAIVSFALGKVTVDNGVVLYDGVELNNVLTQRILSLMNEGFGFSNMIAFLENLKLNPSKRSVDQLYSFLEHRALPITEDGCFLAYKAVKSDFMDKYSGKFNNSVGSIVEMNRNEVDDDPSSACSQGLHCGAMGYVRGYHGGDGRVVIVKVNPRDAVSVPLDHNCEKLRVCRYEVVAEMTDLDKVLEKAVYTSTAEELPPEDHLSDVEADEQYARNYELGFDLGKEDALGGEDYSSDVHLDTRDGYEDGYEAGYTEGEEELDDSAEDNY